MQQQSKFLTQSNSINSFKNNLNKLESQPNCMVSEAVV